MGCDAQVPPTSPVPAPAGRAGVAALVGRANVGKSSLVNALVGEKVSIVSPVAQTTRHRIRAVLNEPRGQLVLLDTPGILRAESELGRRLNRTARQTAEEVDAVVLTLDVSQPPREEDEGWMRRFRRAAIPLVFALNKADLGRDGEKAIRTLWGRVATEPDAPQPAWAVCSAATGEGLDALRGLLFERLPAGPPLFPPDVLSDFPRKLFIADVIREKLFGRLRDELPHRVAVEVQEVRETDDGALEVAADIWVERGSQKPIVIGHKGRVLRAVRRAAAAELSALYERPVGLDLHVTVREHWTRNHWLLKRLGLDL